MKNFILLLIVIIGLGTIFSCKNSGYKKVSGISDFDIKTLCIANNIGQLVINDMASYRALYGNPYNLQHCDSLAYIDFSQHTLLLKYTEYTGCDVKFSHSLLVNDKDKEYRFIIDISSSSCSWGLLSSSYNFVLTPKLNSNYQINFIVNK
jgi:hypothetical protein